MNRRIKKKDNKNNETPSMWFACMILKVYVNPRQQIT